jgi:hypothetical protein
MPPYDFICGTICLPKSGGNVAILLGSLDFCNSIIAYLQRIYSEYACLLRFHNTRGALRTAAIRDCLTVPGLRDVLGYG